MTDTPETLLRDMADALLDVIARFETCMACSGTDKDFAMAATHRQRKTLAKYDAYVESRETGG